LDRRIGTDPLSRASHQKEKNQAQSHYDQDSKPGLRLKIPLQKIKADVICDHFGW
jgi:ribosome assembly protein YihI (activator of Der GTPase)